jgi:hypothetical protein
MKPLTESDFENERLKAFSKACWTTEAKFLYLVWTRFFAVVGRVYSPKFTAKPGWYLRSTWTTPERSGALPNEPGIVGNS